MRKRFPDSPHIRAVLPHITGRYTWQHEAPDDWAISEVENWDDDDFLLLPGTHGYPWMLVRNQELNAPIRPQQIAIRDLAAFIRMLQALQAAMEASGDA